MPSPGGDKVAIQIGNETYTSYEDYIQKTVNVFEGIGDMFSSLDERLDYLNRTALKIETALKGEPVTEFTPSPKYRIYIRENVNIFEKIGDALSGADERLDFLNETFLRLAGLLVPTVPGIVPVIPGVPGLVPGVPVGIPEIVVELSDLILLNVALDIRSFLIMLYRLGRAYEIRLFSYLEVDAAGTLTYTYTIPNEKIYIPHVEEVNLGLQRVITRYDYEGGNIINTETYATDRTVEWTMTPLSRVVSGSFGVSFYNGGTTDTWVKSRFLGTLMRESDYLLWKRLIRTISGKYVGVST